MSFTLVGLDCGSDCIAASKEPVEPLVAFEAQHVLDMGVILGAETFIVHYNNAFCVFPFAATAKPKQIN